MYEDKPRSLFAKYVIPQMISLLSKFETYAEVLEQCRNM